MLKNLLAVLLISTSFGQVSYGQSFAINTDGSVANASALLDVKSTVKGVLVPRMLKSEKNGIALPAAGLLVYQTGPDSAGFHYYDGASWKWIEERRKKIDTLTYNTSIDLAGGTFASPVLLVNKGPYIGVLPNTAGVDDHYELPNPVTNPGRTFYIRNNNGTINAYLKTTVGSLICPGGGACYGAGVTYQLNNNSSGKTVICISDGTNWTVGKMD